MAAVACVGSGATLSVTGVAGDGETRFRVTPLITLETVLLVLLMGMPSTTKDAFKPVTALLNVRPEVLAETLMSPGAPVVSLTRARRAPLASLMTLARTPMDWLLMAAARPSSVFSEELMVTVAAAVVPTWI